MAIPLSRFSYANTSALLRNGTLAQRRMDVAKMGDWAHPRPRAAVLQDVVGTGRFELPTCRLGGDRSIQLSYVPESKTILPALEAFAADVAAELHPFEADGRGSAV